MQFNKLAQKTANVSNENENCEFENDKLSKRLTKSLI